MAAEVQTISIPLSGLIDSIAPELAAEFGVSEQAVREVAARTFPADKVFTVRLDIMEVV